MKARGYSALTGVAALLISPPVVGEAFKGQDLGGFLGSVFLTLLGVPVALGAGVYGLLRLSDQDYTAPWGMSVFFSCVAWWGTMYLLAGSTPAPSGTGFLLCCASATAAAGGYYVSREPKPE